MPYEFISLMVKKAGEIADDLRERAGLTDLKPKANCFLQAVTVYKNQNKKTMTILTPAVNLEIEIDETSYQLIFANHKSTPVDSAEKTVHNIVNNLQ